MSTENQNPNPSSWLRQILDNAERDVTGWPTWLQKLRDGASLDSAVVAVPRGEMIHFCHTFPSGTEARVISDIVLRQQKGVSKYGVTVENNPLSRREWLQHAYEEALDMAVYLKRAIEEIDKGE